MGSCLKNVFIFLQIYTPVVLKNTPEINEKLRTVKHLLRIKPVTFPYGLPVDEEDYKHCYLRYNGEFVVRHRINDRSDEIEKAWAEVGLTEGIFPLIQTMTCRSLIDRALAWSEIISIDIALSGLREVPLI